ncbi:hypothetical protein [Paenarthrobacter aromaticivorans]|uniref:hypothetical protein n=1 Tax=Paenarthrobacter aromaticivorans TaxID=2849150 RepID=UPI003A80A6F5
MARSSKATWNAVFSMFGPYFIANIIMLITIIFFVVTQPKINDPSTYWSIVLVGLLLLAAVVFVVKGALGLRRVNAEAREGRRRHGAGLPLEREEREPPETRSADGYRH